MCDGGLIIGAILSVVTAIVTTNNQNDMADDQQEAIDAQAAANTEALLEKSEEVTSDENLAKFKRQRQQQLDVASTRVAQSEAGVGYGVTSLREMATTLIGGQQDLALIDEQGRRSQRAIDQQIKSVQTGAAIQSAGLSWTSPLMAGLGTVTAGIRGGIAGHNAYTQLKQ